MNILCINTCLEQCYVALVKDELYFEATKEENKQHSITLLKQIDEVMNSANLTPHELNFIAVCVGTGSFTGIRIGIAVAKGMASALNLPIIPIDTLSLIAYNTLEKCDYVIMKGIADEYFIGDVNEQKFAENQRLINQKELNELLNSDKTVCTMDDIDFNCQIVKNENISMKDMSLRLVNSAKPADEIVPLYLRLSQAEMQKKK